MRKGDQGCRQMKGGLDPGMCIRSSSNKCAQDWKASEGSNKPIKVLTYASQIIPLCYSTTSTIPLPETEPIGAPKVLINTAGKVNTQCSNRGKLNGDCSKTHTKLILNKSFFLNSTLVVHNPEDTTNLIVQPGGNQNDEQIATIPELCQNLRDSLSWSVDKWPSPKEVECCTTINQLHTSRQTIQQLECQLRNYQESMRSLNILVQESRTKANQLEFRLRSSEEDIAKRSMLVGRLRHLERQTSFLKVETLKQDAVIIQLTTRNSELVSSIASLKEEISTFISNSVETPYAQIYSLKKQLAAKNSLIGQLQAQVNQSMVTRDQVQSLVDSKAKYCSLLEEGNQGLMRQRLREMNAKMKAIRLY